MWGCEVSHSWTKCQHEVEGDNLFHTGTGNVRGEIGSKNRQYPTIEHWNGYIREETSGPEDRKVMYTEMPSCSFVFTSLTSTPLTHLPLKQRPINTPPSQPQLKPPPTPIFKMRFSTIAVLAVFAAFAAASNETVTVENLTIRDNDGIQAAELTLQPANVTCSANGSALADYSVALCGDSKYRFAVNGSNSVYDLRLYKELGVA
jgi:hypothetical protein